MPDSAERTQAMRVRGRRPVFGRPLTDGEMNWSRATITGVLLAKLFLATVDYSPREIPLLPPTSRPPIGRERISAGARTIYAGTSTEEYFNKSSHSRFDAVYCGKSATESGSDIYVGFPVIPDLSGNLLHQQPGMETPVVGALEEGEITPAQRAVYRQIPGAGGEQTWIDLSTSEGTAFLLAEDEKGNVNAATPGEKECRAGSKMGSL